MRIKVKVFDITSDIHNSGQSNELFPTEAEWREGMKLVMEEEMYTQDFDYGTKELKPSRLLAGPECEKMAALIAGGDIDAAWEVFNGEETRTHPKHPDDWYSASELEIEVELPEPYASAKDLLESAAGLLDWLEQMFPDEPLFNGNGFEQSFRIKDVRAAISKAGKATT